MLQLRVQLKAEHVESVEELFFHCGALSVSLEDAADHPILEPKLGEHPIWPSVYLRALFHESDNIELCERALENKALSSSPIIFEQIDNDGWQEKFQQQFEPIHYAKRLWIYPSWQQNPDPSGLSLQLDPGLAFGTGKHPTTELCIQWLCNGDIKNKTVIDFGCGSGILALAAAKLGAARVYAVDIDPQAIIATNENIKRNQIPNGIIQTGQVDQLRSIQADILMANILAGPLCELQTTFAIHTHASSNLVLSGILQNQSQRIIDHYAPQFRCTQQQFLDQWARLSFTPYDSSKHL